MLWLLVACQPPPEPVVDPEVFRIPADLAGCAHARQVDTDLDGDIDLYYEDAYDLEGRLIRQDERREGEYFEFWSREYAADGCETTTTIEHHTDGGAYEGTVREVTCDEEGNPVREHHTHTLGEWGIEEVEVWNTRTLALNWENTYLDGVLVGMRRSGVNWAGAEMPVLLITLRYDSEGRENWRETVWSGTHERVETVWYDDDTFLERVEFVDDRVLRTELQQLDGEGRVTRYEYYFDGDLWSAVDSSWSELSHTPIAEASDTDGDGVIDGISHTTCEGVLSEYCETQFDGRSWRVPVAGPLDGAPDALLLQSWICPSILGV